MLPWVATAFADPLASWRAAAQARNPVGLPRHVPTALRADAQWLVAIEGAQAGDPLPIARWLQAHPGPSPLADAGREWVLVALRDQAFDRNADPGVLLDQLWDEAPWDGSVHQARLGLLHVLDRYAQPEPAFEARVAAAIAADRAEELPAFALRLIAPDSWGASPDPARIQWVRQQLAPGAPWWAVPHRPEVVAEARQVLAFLPSMPPADAPWPAPAPPPAAPPATAGPGSRHPGMPWVHPVPHLAPWLDAPDPDIAAEWNAGRYREALRAAERWARTHPDEPRNWVRWARAWTRPGTGRGADDLRAIVADPRDPTYRWAAAYALVEHLLAPTAGLEATPDDVRTELAALFEVLPDTDAPRDLFLARWRLAAGDRAGAERWGQRALRGTREDELAARAFLAENDLAVPPEPPAGRPRVSWAPPEPPPERPWETSEPRLCCAVGHATPILVAVGGTARAPDPVPYVPLVTQDSCTDLTPWLLDVRSRLGACFRAPSRVEGVWTVTRDGTTGPDEAVSSCLEALEADGPRIGFTVVVHDLRRLPGGPTAGL